MDRFVSMVKFKDALRCKGWVNSVNINVIRKLITDVIMCIF